ncbi:MAG: HEAT repeat domain-containing protein [Cellulosilyticaceae bacterium]
MFWKKKKETDLWQKTMLEAIRKLNDGELSQLKSVYQVFGSQNKNIIQQASLALFKQLSNFSNNQMSMLDEQFRQYTSLEWFVDWQKVNLKFIRNCINNQEQWMYIVILGSFHPNGYFREKCTLELAKSPNTLSYLILRMNDWVSVIRRKATSLAFERIQTCPVHEILSAMQQIEKLKYCGRRESEAFESFYEEIVHRIQSENQGIEWYKISQYDPKTKSAIYKVVLSKKILDISLVNRLLEWEKDPSHKGYIIGRIINLYDCTVEQLEAYLKNKNSQVRYKALVYRFQQFNELWDNIEEFLIDSNRSIREYTCYILKKYAQFDVIAFYKAHLHDEIPDNAIKGIGENGTAEHEKCLLPFLESENQRTVKATLEALSKLIQGGGLGIYERYLFDQRIAISKVAYHAIKNNKILIGADKLYEQITKTQCQHTKRYLILLLTRERAWYRLPYLIYLYDVEDEVLRKKIREAIDCRNLYEKISSLQSQQIKQAIAEQNNILPESLVKSLLTDLKYVEK